MPFYQMPSLTHLDRLTDSTGIIQHGIYGLPRRESGYTTDDNARALRLSAHLWKNNPSVENLGRTACYLSFMEHARSPARGFHNFMGYQRDWLDSGGTEDCQGQAILSLADVAVCGLPIGFRDLALELLRDALPAAKELKSLRAIAYLIQAWHLLRHSSFKHLDDLESIAHRAADQLVDRFGRSKRREWFWFEASMTYANAVLSHALFDAADLWGNDPYLTVAETTFGFLELSTVYDGYFSPVGNREWYANGEEKSMYDQQPVEASTMAAAALAAWRVTEEPKYLRTFQRAYDWFTGQNNLGIAVANPIDGSCCDGLTPSGMNQNQGAESTLAYLWTALLGEQHRLSQFPQLTEAHIAVAAGNH